SPCPTAPPTGSTWGRSLTSWPSASSSSPTAGSAISPARTSPSASRATAKAERGGLPMSRVVLTDIEGTTSPIAFVKEVLFPYARSEMPRFVRVRGHEPEVRRWLDEVDNGLGAVCQDGMLCVALQRC